MTATNETLTTNPALASLLNAEGYAGTLRLILNAMIDDAGNGEIDLAKANKAAIAVQKAIEAARKLEEE
jgi:hypothetical protein